MQLETGLRSRQKEKTLPGEKLKKKQDDTIEIEFFLHYKKEIFFTTKFFIIFFALQFIILTIPLAPLENFIAKTEADAMQLNSFENKIFFDSQSFEITANCTGLLSGAILAAVIFAVKKPGLKKKIAIAIVGGIILFLLNFPRIFFVLAVGKQFGEQTAELLHEITWFTTALLVLIVWFFGMKKIARIKNFAELI